MNKTYREIFRFNSEAQRYIATAQGEDKLTYALKKMQRKLVPIIESYNEKLEDLRIEHCAVNDKGVITKDQNGQYQFTKEGQKKLTAEGRKLFESAVEIEPHYATEVPDLDEGVKESFMGFVIRD